MAHGPGPHALETDVVVIGSGPNGLAAAVTMARGGCSVLVLEAAETPGGGARSAELTVPGFVHDVCSAVHPLAFGSPFFRATPLANHGLEFVQLPISVAHPLGDGSAGVLERSLAATAAGLGPDGPAYRAMFEPLIRNWPLVEGTLLGPLRPPRHPVALMRFSLLAMRSAVGLARARFRGQHARARFRGQHARALFAGMAAHSMLPLEGLGTAAFGLVMGILGHVAGWPIARGGSQRIIDALVAHLRTLNGRVLTGQRVDDLAALSSRAVLCDVSPRELIRIGRGRLPDSYCRRLERFRYGVAAFKVDWALGRPIPWRAEACRQTAIVHVGGTLDEVAAAEAMAARGQHPERPFIILTQPSLFDPSRAPADRHTAWAYCHVPNGSDVDMTDRIESQIERFAPGFRDSILARHVMNPRAFERYNANYVGGDINGGAQDLWQLFTRPIASLVPYATPTRGVYLCSSSTPPGGGVHGMCGYWAARFALRNVFGRRAQNL